MLLNHTLGRCLVFTLATIVSLGGLATAQQQPSKRFQPVPPSVHIPTSEASALYQRPQGQFQKSKFQRAAEHQLSQRKQAVSHNFSDTPDVNKGMIQQTSYSAPASAPANVPAILAGSIAQQSQQIQQQQQQTSQPPRQSTQFPARTTQAPVSATNSFDPGQARLGNTMPRQTGELTTNQPMARQEATAFPPAQDSPQVDPDALRRQQELIQQQLAKLRQQMEATKRVAETSERKISGMPATEPVRTAMSNPAVNEAPSQPMAAPIASKFDPASAVRTVSNNSSNLRRESGAPKISFSAPSIDVDAFGPMTIGINKEANYEVHVKNSGRIIAEKIMIGIDLPEWVDIQNVNITGGTKETTDRNDEARLVWSIDQIAPGATQTVSIVAIPRKAEVFDLGIEWAYAPRSSSTSIAVTEPRLEMQIAGPREVQFGEKELYHVTVRNPGTGDAENVNVMLPEALGGERAPLGNIPAGREKNFQVELLARTAGELDLIATATGEGELKVSANREIIVRRANLTVGIQGPPMKYAGSVGRYTINIKNNGDAIANEVIAAVLLPKGVKYLSGVESVKESENGIKWPVGSLEPGDQRSYKINCELNAAGDLRLEAGARGHGDLAATNVCQTTVDTIADLVLSVHDPKGPLPTGETVNYEIRIKNRGTRSAREVNLVMQFSEGIEPSKADAPKHKIVPGQVLFAPISQIEPGQEIKFNVTAKAHQNGTHTFRAQLTCADSDSREIAEGTTRFFGDAIEHGSRDSSSKTADRENEFRPTGGFER